MRDVAFWPKKFLDEVEGARVTQGALLHALGGPSFAYRTAEVLAWIDPYFYGTPDDSVPDAYRAVPISIKPDEVGAGDIIFSTHDHVDHCHEGSLLPMLANTEAFCIAPASSARLMRGFGIPDERIREVKPGDSISHRDLTVRVYPSYDPNEPLAVSYILDSGGTTFFVSGDTSDGPALAEVGEREAPDYALLAFGRTWYMDEAEMLRVASILRPGTLLPFHWEFWRNHTGDIVKFFELYFSQKPDFDVKILSIGDSLHMGGRAPDEGSRR
ncbi:MAG: MBL fold metallo-hydrolase [Anaerolineaceae bacterium]|nr:MBL fold metallo-hydrolase [Anaerolineaceae bacterium]